MWEKLVQEFKNYLKIERNLSDNTISSYLFDLKKFYFFLSKNNMDTNPLKIKKSTLKEFIYHISKQVQPSTQARMISGLKRFFEYLILENLIEENPLENIETPKIGRKLPETLSVEEIDLIIKNINTKSKNKLRNTALIEVLYSCGLRVSELITLKISIYFSMNQLSKLLEREIKKDLFQLVKRQ
jgi:integrase/recombinase XerD